MTAFDQMVKDQKASINFFNPQSMAVNISKQDDHYIVNNKTVYQDSNSNWIATEELTTGEQKAFRLHLSKVTGLRGRNKRP